MFAVIDIPEFPLQAVVRTERALRGEPLVLVEEQGRQSRVLRLNKEAADAAVELGMTLAQALARCAGLQVRNPSPAAERVAAAALFDAAYAFAARAEVTAPGLITVDMTGLPPGNLEARGQALHAQLWELGLWARIGFAPTPQLAHWAARWASPLRIVDDRREFLDALPIHLAEPTEDLRKVLQQWGIRTLGALLRLPRQDVATRLGTEALALWDGASATEPRLLRLTQPPATFEEEMDLEHPLETLDPLLFLLRRFLDQLCVRLANAGQVAGNVALELRLDAGPPHARSFRVPEPTRDAGRLFRMLHAHLEQVTTDAPIVAVRLHIDPADERARQQGLFETSLVNPHRFADTLAELTGIAGPGNVGRPQPLDTHRPDAFEMGRLPDVLEEVAGDRGKVEGSQWKEGSAHAEGRKALPQVAEEQAAYGNVLHVDFSAAPESPQDAPAPPSPTFAPSYLHTFARGPLGPASAGCPLRRLRPPAAAQVSLGRDGTPLSIRSHLARGRIRAAAGPWNSSGDWWETRTQWGRSEWDIELTKGGIYRIFQCNDEWFIEGEYG